MNRRAAPRSGSCGRACVVNEPEPVPPRRRAIGSVPRARTAAPVGRRVTSSLKLVDVPAGGNDRCRPGFHREGICRLMTDVCGSTASRQGRLFRLGPPTTRPWRFPVPVGNPPGTKKGSNRCTDGLGTSHSPAMYLRPKAMECRPALTVFPKLIRFALKPSVSPQRVQQNDARYGVARLRSPTADLR